MAVSLLGRPSEQAWFVIGPSVPCIGGVTIAKVSSQSFRSAPLRVTSSAASWSVTADTSAALGGAGFGSVGRVVVVLVVVVVVAPGRVVVVSPGNVVVVSSGSVVVVTGGSAPMGTMAASSGAITVFPYCCPTLVGCAVGTVNCHCWASISVSASGDCRLSVSLLKK